MNTLLINCINDQEDIKLVKTLTRKEEDKVVAMDETYNEISGMDTIGSNQFLRLTCDFSNIEQFKQLLGMATEKFDQCIIGGFGKYGVMDITTYLSFFGSHVNVLDFLTAYGIKTYYRPLMALEGSEGEYPQHKWTQEVKTLIMLSREAGLNLADFDETAKMELELYGEKSPIAS